LLLKHYKLLFKVGKATKCKNALFIKAYSGLPTTLWQVKLLKKGLLCAVQSVSNDKNKN